jgi:enoyl-CoA hydratase/carnithine racemase
MSTGFDSIVYERVGEVARVLLNRPQVINAFNVQMRDELYQVFQAIKDDSEIKAVILAGAGDRGFCAGADLTEFGTAPSQVIARQIRWERDLWGLFLELPQPLVCALHGHVIGSGVEMALLCDLRVAADDAMFSMPEVRLGMIPAAGGTQTMARNIGIPSALDLLLLQGKITAAEAKKIGMVHRVVPREKLEQESLDLANSLARKDVSLLQAYKTALRRGSELSLSQGLDLEERLNLQSWCRANGS